MQRLARPIDFASRDAFAHIAAVKNLGPYVTAQVAQALSDAVYPKHIEADLLALRHYLADFDGLTHQAERIRRVTEAQAVVRRLQAVTPEALAPPPPAPMRAAAPPAHDLWNLSIQYAKGVGPKRAALFARLGIKSVEDALWYLPWRYEDRSQMVPIGRLTPGQAATVCGVVASSRLKQAGRRRLTILEVTVEDESGAVLAVFFNQSYLEGQLKPGTRLMLNGTAVAGRGGWTRLRMDSPQYETLGEEQDATVHVGRIVPIYHETKGLSSRQIRTVQRHLLDQFAGAMEDVVPPAVRQRHNLPPLTTALTDVHFPPPASDPAQLERGVTPAHQRLAFEECFLLELALASRHQSVKEEIKGIRFDPDTRLTERLRQALPFRLTAAQERVIGDIRRDMASLKPMNRLVQGDVGSGKTVIALYAMVVACGSGYQAAFMAPTEILAEQHYLNLHPVLDSLGIEAVLLKGGTGAKQRRAVAARIESGQAHVVIGTHALIQKGVTFARLGLAVVDEQHKFGVLQRKTLVQKGYRPDMLVMTATPIPRTLAMTVYGDLDVSVIDELPPGRKPVRTLVFGEGKRRQAYDLLADEVRAGRQGYVVFPLVEESEKVDLQAAMQAAERLQAKEFRWTTVGLLHGRMKTDEKERTMAAFKRGELRVLVATTVIEVGVDVSNATVMLVEHAERFGLAQLHQLRGRVGRSAQQAYCLLLASGWKGDTQGAVRRGARPPSPSQQRLDALVRSTDGFVIAEEDLRIRGPGEFFGVRQWGVPEFHAVNLVRDAALLEQARREAFALIDADPRFARPEHRGLRQAMLRKWQAKLELGSVG